MRSCPRCRSLYSEASEFCGLDGQELVDSATDPLVGETIDRYEIVSRLGAGATGCVYRARHTRIKRSFAIKVLFGEMASNKQIAARFHREATAASQMSHPNIVSVLDFGTTDTGLTYLAMELVEGPSLADAIEAIGPFETPRAVAVLRGIAEGLREAHSRGFVHRDLKPGNVMLASHPGGEQPMILDFGLVALTDDGDGESKLTRTGSTLGTPAYMAPEQARGADVGPAADLYALGCIGYELLRGHPPFAGPIATVLVSKLSKMPTPLETQGPLQDLVWRLLATDPADRPHSAAHVIDALAAIEQGSGPIVVGATAPSVDRDSTSSDSAGARPAEPAIDIALPMLGFIEAPMAIQVASRDAQLRPALVRAWGISATADGKSFDVFLSVRQSEQVLANLRANGTCAINVADPVDLRGVQIKGRAEVLGPVDDSTRARIERYRDDLFERFSLIGFPREGCMGLWCGGEFARVRVRPTRLYDQTPGDGAGNRIEQPWSRL